MFLTVEQVNLVAIFLDLFLDLNPAGLVAMQWLLMDGQQSQTVHQAILCEAVVMVNSVSLENVGTQRHLRSAGIAAASYNGSLCR